jgi:hypothetical protein
MASADPHIFVEPTFANASEFTLLISDGIENVPLTTPARRSPTRRHRPRRIRSARLAQEAEGARDRLNK